MSRRARSRPDKRAIVYYTGEATDIEAAFAKLTAERGEKQEPEDRLLHLKNGGAIDKRQPWSFPTNSKGAT